MMSQSPYDDIFEAAKSGTVEDIIYFIGQGVNINEKKNDERLMTPLCYAAANNSNVDVLRFLIKHGSDVHVKDKQGDTPLHWAAACNEPAMMECLIANGADIRAKNEDGKTPLHESVKFHDPDYDDSQVAVMQYLINHGADVYAKDVHGKTPLDYIDPETREMILGYCRFAPR